jgi:hypothetical protein
MDLDQLLALGADPSPVAHRAPGLEQIALDHEAVEAPGALPRVDPVQHQVVLHRRRLVVLHRIEQALVLVVGWVGDWHEEHDIAVPILVSRIAV